METDGALKITDLIAPRAIDLDAHVATKPEALDRLTTLANAAGYLWDAAAFRAALQVREETVTTGIGGGLALPHARGDFVSQPGLCVMRAPGGCAFDTLDKQPAYLFFMITCPPDSARLHTQVISHLSALLLNRDLRQKLMEAETPAQFCAMLDAAQSAETAAMATRKNAANSQAALVAVTACPTGVAHTYMAAEALDLAAEQLGIALKIETDGASGVENALTPDDIQASTAVIIAADRQLDLERFESKPMLRVSVTDAITRPAELLKQAAAGDLPLYHAPAGGASSEPAGPHSKRGFGKAAYDALMAGVSAMLPFVTVGGLMLSIAFLMDSLLRPDASILNFGRNSEISAFFHFVGNAAFDFMLPVMAAFIARAIAGMPGFLTGFVGGCFASEGACRYLDTFVTADTNSAPVTSAGFLGALAAGFLAGPLVLFLQFLLRRMPRSMEAVRSILIIPFLGMVILGLSMLLFLDPALSWVNDRLSHSLLAMHTGMTVPSVLLCAAAAAMMAVDFGGPVNKAAYLVGTVSLTLGGEAQSTELMAAVLLGGMVPPLAIALCTTFFPNRFTRRQRTSGASNYVLGLCFVTEGALPLAMSDPLRVVPACVVGSAVAGGLSAAFACTLSVPTGGIFVFPFATNPAFYLFALIAGSLVGMFMLALLRHPLPPKQSGLPERVRP